MRVDTKVAVLIPTLGRPHRVPEIVENVKETAPNARVHFIAEADDWGTIAVLKRSKATIGDFGTYGKAINAGYLGCREPVVMTCDDDCVFHDGWIQAALKEMKGKVRVVGTNDLHNPYVLSGDHSTHSFIDRRYIDAVGCVVDAGPGSVLFEYDHNYTDAELVETAKARGVFAPCLESVVEHIHPEFGGREPDDTWNKTRRAVQQDFETFNSRRHLWTNPETALEYREVANR